MAASVVWNKGGGKEQTKTSQDYLSELCHTAEIFHLLLLHFHSSCSHDRFLILLCWELLETNLVIKNYCNFVTSEDEVLGVKAYEGKATAGGG